MLFNALLKHFKEMLCRRFSPFGGFVIILLSGLSFHVERLPVKTYIVADEMLKTTDKVCEVWRAALPRSAEI